jgi:anhydro-N-acetylmuramic acid kinase
MKKQNYRVVGVMSGTSLDGIDLCEVEFDLKNQKWDFRMVKAETVPYTKQWVDQLKNAHLLTRNEVYNIDAKYTKYLSKVISDFVKDSISVDLICSHGHTIWHQPEKGFTCQIGNLPEIARYVGETVVCDFRTADVKLGGQGAPLVPIGDRLLFPEFDYCLNIGGFANVSFEEKGNRIAFDICPANKALNLYAEKTGVKYDDKGRMASTGKLHIPLFEALNSLNYYSKSPPKSLGVEWLEAEFLPVVESYNASIEDKQHTLSHHIAFQISKILEIKASKVLITGGGAYHDFLLSCLKKYATSNEIIVPDPMIVEYKEALIFGLLGVLRFRNEINVLSSVTGATTNHSSGEVFDHGNS